MSNLHVSQLQGEMSSCSSGVPRRAQIGQEPWAIHNPQQFAGAWAWETVRGKSLLENQGWDVVAGAKAWDVVFAMAMCGSTCRLAEWVQSLAQGHWPQFLAGKGSE